MKITHITRKMNMQEHPGGVETFILELAQKQIENGHQVEIICRNQFQDTQEDKINGIKIKRAETIGKPGLGTLSSLYSMRKLIQEQETDIFHIHDWSPYLNYLFAGKPRRHILTVHDLHNETIQRKIQNFAITNSDKVVMVSEEMNQRTQKQNYEVIPNGVNAEKFENTEDTENYALFVGDLNDRKGFKELITNWPKDVPQLKVVGTGKYKCLENEYKKHQFLGRVPEERLKQLYGKAKYVVLPSRREGFCLVWLEALASGTPVLYTNTGIGPKIPDYCGIMINSDYDEKELQEGIERLLEDKFDNQKLRRYVEQEFSWQKVYEQYLQLYLQK